MRQPWTANEDLQLEALLTPGDISAIDIAKKMNRTIDSVRGRIKGLSLSNRYQYHRYTKNETFFSVPNPVNAYYAGYIGADGSVSHEDRCVRWSTEENDAECLQGFKEATKYTGKIGFKLNVAGLGANPSRQNFLDVYAAKQWCEDLERNFGVIPNKSKRLAPPNTRNDLLNLCFILGYIDGDGSLSFVTKNGEVQNGKISITSASPLVLGFIKAMFDRMFPIENGVHRKTSCVCHYENYYMYSVCGARAVRVFDLLRSLPCPHLTRKWHNPEILHTISLIKSKHPDLFKEANPLYFDSTGTLCRHPEPQAASQLSPTNSPILV